MGRSPSFEAALATQAAAAKRMSAEAAYYWERHAGRFEFVLRYLQQSGWERVRTVLDIGGSFQTLLLADVFPEWRIDTMGKELDPRFALPPPSRQHMFDLDAIDRGAPLAHGGVRYDLIVFMEVIEHLVVPPHRVLQFLAAQLAEGGRILLTTPNAAWLKNRLKLLRGRNPFEPLREGGGGHIREYTLDELQAAAAQAGLTCEDARHCGLYRFAGAKDRFYNALANATLPSLRRSLFLVLSS